MTAATFGPLGGNEPASAAAACRAVAHPANRYENRLCDLMVEGASCCILRNSIGPLCGGQDEAKSRNYYYGQHEEEERNGRAQAESGDMVCFNGCIECEVWEKWGSAKQRHDAGGGFPCILYSTNVKKRE